MRIETLLLTYLLSATCVYQLRELESSFTHKLGEYDTHPKYI